MSSLNIHASPSWSVDYFLTVTVSPTVRKFAPNAPEQLGFFVYYDETSKKTCNKIHDLFAHHKLKYKMSLVCEITKSFDLHFHSIVSFDLASIPMRVKLTGRMDYYLKSLFKLEPKTFGFIDIRPIDNFHKVRMYMLKEINDTFINLGYSSVTSVILQDDYKTFYDDVEEQKDFGWQPKLSKRIQLVEYFNNKQLYKYVFTDDEKQFLKDNEKKDKFQWIINRHN